MIEYKGHGVFETRKKKTDTPTKQAYSKIGMIAGGSGITPMLQVEAFFAILLFSSNSLFIC